VPIKYPQNENDCGQAGPDSHRGGNAEGMRETAWYDVERWPERVDAGMVIVKSGLGPIPRLNVRGLRKEPVVPWAGRCGGRPAHLG
jgi:hypothetical protein